MHVYLVAVEDTLDPVVVGEAVGQGEGVGVANLHTCSVHVHLHVANISERIKW